MAKSKRKVPGLNGSSTADISFILLIFFLTTTSMNVDSGLERRLPPPPDPNQQEDDVKVKARNVLVVAVNMYNEISYYYGDQASGQRVFVQDVQPKDLRAVAKEFIANPENKPNMPEFHPADPPLPIFGTPMVTKNHIISVQTDRTTKYEVYFQIQNELMAAYRELRDELGMKSFGKPFVACNEEEQSAIKGVYPMKISEAEPKKYGGN